MAVANLASAQALVKDLATSGLTFNDLSAREVTPPELAATNSPTAKKCFECKEVKDANEFYIDRSRRDRLSGRCKVCHKLNNGRYFQRNREKLVLKNKNWQETNRESHYKAVRRWKKNNPENIRVEQNNQRHKRRAKKKGGDRIALDVLYNRDKGVCQVCKLPCLRKVASLDHIKPLSKGGKHIWSNVQLAHLVCNARKGNRG